MLYGQTQLGNTIGFWDVKNLTNTQYKIDHLHQTTTTSDIKWSYPSTEDIQFAEKEQLIACKIEGMWELHDTRNTNSIY